MGTDCIHRPDCLFAGTALIAAAQGYGDFAVFQLDGMLVQTVHSGQADINALAYSPDGQTLATSSIDNTLKLWQMSDFTCTQTLTETTSVYTLAFSPDGQLLASAGYGADGIGHIQLWQVSNSVCRQSIACSGAVTSLSFSPDGQTLAAGIFTQFTGTGSIQLWRVSDGACLQTFAANGPVQAVAYAPDGQTLASGGYPYNTSFIMTDNGFVQLWRVSDGTCLQTLAPDGPVYALAYAPDGRTLASGNMDYAMGSGTVQLWRMSDGICLRSITSLESYINSLAFVLNGQALLTGYWQHICLWQVSDGACLLTYVPTSDPVNAVAFSPEARRWPAALIVPTLAALSSGKPAMAATKLTLPTWYETTSVAYSPDGQTLATCSYDGDELSGIGFWRTSDGASLWQWGEFPDVTSIAFTPDGQSLAMSSNCAPGSGGMGTGSIMVMQVSDANMEMYVNGLNQVNCIALSPDGQTLASVSNDPNGDSLIQLWQVSDGACLEQMTPAGYYTFSIAFSPDGQTLASGTLYASLVNGMPGNGFVQLWNVSDGACLQTLATAGPVNVVACSPDGQTLASGGSCFNASTGSDSGCLQLWRMSDGACLQTLTGMNFINSLAFSPDGQSLASGSYDGVALWTLALPLSQGRSPSTCTLRNRSIPRLP